MTPATGARNRPHEAREGSHKLVFRVRQHASLQWARRDDGSISIMFAVLAMALLGFIFVVVDGGGQVRAAQRADNIATEAARAAGQAIDVPQAISGGQKQLNPYEARRAGEAYLAQAGATGTVEILDLTHIKVTASIEYRPIMLGNLGHGPIKITATAQAQLVTG